MKPIGDDDSPLTAVITYNTVAGFPPGLYKGPAGRVAVVSNDKPRPIVPPDIALGAMLGSIIGDPGMATAYRAWSDKRAASANRTLGDLLDLAAKDILPAAGSVFVYAGVNALDGALSAAGSLKDAGKDLALVACGCNASIKRDFAGRMGVPIVWSDCGGRRKLGDIVKDCLGTYGGLNN
jgi:hypothetical protein